MNLMSSKIYLRNVRFHAFHGVLPQEGIVGNDYLVNLVLDYDFSSALKTDDLQGTLNYAEVYQKVKEEMAVPSKLLEHVAGRIAHRLFSDFPEIQKLQLSITKVNPPMGADSDGAGVEVVLTNDKTYS
ncbi:dihydroneopterin aldolase [Prevotella copri]|jgi:dihydroneopterin aldolase|uniref:7,8-dihydroneopterin aldolase n=1 Tax=Segatella copri TaxID=165179 RepID=A0AAW5IMV6_9BACT|nr:dihydroneopterin aldolase [Segatella copri]MCP9534690.1 dihydroneopterin aldolase [Segatella copri]MCP9537601.1 dihydroneopterin aldolase [Segatella copri]MCP9540540.1 dihydroneopterin aldolase [Segatella copri]MCP9558813.1 dihydroneopterin aldolase [Segatella copri]MCP9561479.1 dihydroneopterin aldolase [Segatella copri]